MRRLALFLAALLLTLPLAGCWDMKEINSQSYILGLGMDATDNDGVYLFTFQRAVPVGIDSSADSNSIQYENISVTAPSLAQAVRQLTLSSSMEFSFVHLSCVIIGNELAHHSFAELLEYLMQQTDVRRQCIIAVSSDTASSLLDSTPLHSSSAAAVASLLEELDRSRGHSVAMTLSSVSIAALTDRGYFLYAVEQSDDISSASPGVSSSDAPLGISGAYVFSPDEFIGTLNAQQADMLRLFAVQQNDGMISAAHKSGRTVYFWIDRSLCSISCDIIDDQLYYDVNVTAYCSLADASGLPTSEINTDILEQAISKQAGELIAVSQQKLGPALLGFDDAARKADSRWYSSHSGEFAELFRNAAITLEVSCHLERSGVIN